MIKTLKTSDKDYINYVKSKLTDTELFKLLDVFEHKIIQEWLSKYQETDLYEHLKINNDFLIKDFIKNK